MGRRIVRLGLGLAAMACVLMASNAFAASGSRRPPKKPVVKSETVTGMLAVTKAKADDGTETVTAATVTTKAGDADVVWNVVLDETGKKLAGELAGKKVEVTGTPSEKAKDNGDKEKWLAVKTYKEVKEAPPAEKPAEKA